MNNPKDQNTKINTDLFLAFLRIGFFTFGGGLAMIPLIEEEIVKRKAYLSEEEFVNTIAMVQSMPGAIAINMAGAVGSKINGYKGALACYFGVVLPSFLTIYLIARFFTPYMNHPFIHAFFKGLKPAVVALICVSGWRMKKIIIRDRFSMVVGLSVFLLLVLKNMDPILLLVVAGLAGVMLLRGKIDEYTT